MDNHLMSHVGYDVELVAYKNGELVDRHIPKFLPKQIVYIVKKRFRKIVIEEAEIDYIAFTNIWVYKPCCGKYYDDYDTNIFKNKEEAYKYAEKLDRRRNIKFKECRY